MSKKMVLRFLGIAMAIAMVMGMALTCFATENTVQFVVEMYYQDEYGVGRYTMRSSDSIAVSGSERQVDVKITCEEGYALMGYESNASDFWLDGEFIHVVVGDKDTTLTIFYDMLPETYTITFKNTAGGTLNGSNEDVEYWNFFKGDKFPPLPLTVPNEGYEFAGWYDEDGSLVNVIPEEVTGNRTLTAKWKCIEVEPTEPEPTEPEPTEPEPTEPGKTEDYVPRTGDETNIGFYTVIAVLAMFGIAVTAVCKKKVQIK